MSVDCHTALFTNYDVSSIGACYPLLLSKVLSSSVIAGALVVKAPQIRRVIASKSSEGLDPFMFFAESFGYSLVIGYNTRSGYPFSTYGEAIFMYIQCTMLLFLVHRYSKGGIGARGFAELALVVATLVGTQFAPLGLIQAAFASNIVIFSASKVPQIIKNYRAGSTGNLDAFMFLLQGGGGAARVYTTLAEVPDPTLLLGFVIGTALNFIIFAQIIYYGAAKKVVVQDRKKKQ
jgi:mannose-P-dolichol utilization defect protein 1